MSWKWKRTVVVLSSMLFVGYTGLRAGRIIADTATITVQQLPGTVIEGTTGHQITFRATADAGTDEFGAEFNFSCVTVTGGASCTSVSPSSWILEPNQYKDIVVTFSAGGTLPSQSITLESQAAGSNSTSGTANVSVSRGVTVTTLSIPSSVLQYSETDTAEFNVKNEYYAQKTISFTCSWGGESCTPPSPTSFTSRQTKPIKVALSAGAVLTDHDIVLTATTGVASHADTGSVTVDAYAGVNVVPQRSPVYWVANKTNARDTFDVRAPGQSAQNYTLSVSCPGGSNVNDCSVIGGTTRSIGDTPVSIVVEYDSGVEGNTSAVTLTATQVADNSIGASADMEVVSSSDIQLLLDDATHGYELNRADCPNIAVGSAAIVCGDFQVVYPVTPVTRMNRAHQFALINSSDLVHRWDYTGADFVIPEGVTEPTRIDATYMIEDNTVKTVSYTSANYEPGTRTRIGFYWSGQDVPERAAVVDYDVEIKTYNGTTLDETITASTEFVSLSSARRYGRGWWVAGLEQLKFEGDTIVWQAGDTGGAVYLKSGSKWIKQTRAVPDTIVQSGNDYVRRVLGGGEVHFTQWGYHSKTVDANGNETHFNYQTIASWVRLTSVELPTPGGGTESIYELDYDSTHGGLTAIRVKQADGSGWDTYTVYSRWQTWVPIIDSIRSPTDEVTRFSVSWGPINTVTGPAGDSTTAFYSGPVAGRVEVRAPGVPTSNVYYLEASRRGTENNSGWKGPKASDEVISRLDGHLVGTVDTTSFYTTGWGAVRGIRDADGNETWIDREDGGFPGLPTRVRYPNGREVTTEYTSLGLVDEVTDHSTGGVTRYVWNTTHLQPDSVITAEGVRTAYTYDSDGNRLSEKVVGGEPMEYLYDSNGLVIRVMDPLDNRDTLAYDSLGNLASVTSPLDHTTTYTRDYLGRITETETPIDGTDTKTSAVTYDVMGRVLVEETTNSIDDNWTRVHTTYDSIGRPTQRRAYGDTTTAAQDSMSAGYETWSYDGLGRVVAQQSASKLDSMEYDLAGRVTQIRTRRDFARTDEVTMQYDTLGRLTRRIIPSMTFGTIAGELDSLPYYYPDYVIPADTIEYTYDAMGNALTINNRFTEITRTYTLDGLIATEQQAIAKWSDTTDFSRHVYNLSYSYDRDRRRVGLEHPDWLSYGTDYTTYAYDSRGRIETITGPLGDSYGYTYDNGNRITRRTFPGAGVNGGSYWGYDAGDRLTSHYVRLVNDTVIEATLGHLDSGLIETVDGSWNTDVFYTGSGAVKKNFTQAWEGPQTTENFVMDPFGSQLRSSSIGGEVSDDSTAYENTFDAHGRITATDEVFASETYSQVPLGWDEGWTDFWYDSIGNRTRSRKEQPVWWYNAQVPVLAIKTNTHREETRAFFGADGHMRAYQVNRDSVVHDTIAPIGPDIVAGKWGVWEEYWYDGLGRRVVKMSRQDDPHCDMTARCHSSIERYVWDGNQLLWEVKQDDQGDAQNPTAGDHAGAIGYVHGGDIDAPLAMMRNGEVVVLHQNWRGLFAFSTDEDGDYTTQTPSGGAGLPSIAWPAGNYITFTNNKSKNTQHWYGSLAMDHQDATGLMYRRNRYYDGVTGQFTQTDPIGIAGGLNTYGYTHGDPINFSDPFGLSACCTLVARTALLGLQIGSSVGPLGSAGGLLVGGAIGIGLGVAAGWALDAAGWNLFNEDAEGEAPDLRDLSKGEVKDLKDLIKEDGIPSIEHLKTGSGRGASKYQVRVDKKSGDIVVGPLRDASAEHEPTGYNIRDLGGSR
ncbi:MAG: RHS repeat-associated core domain-containing protein [Gemmatimonadota bacterium]